MATTFGRRGAVAPTPSGSFRRAPPASAALSIAQAVVRDNDQPTPDERAPFESNNLLAIFPFLTVGLIFGLMLIFVLERALAIGIAKNGSLDVRSLIAYGASSYDLVVGRWEWWRIGLAPLLHSSDWHLLGNCVALLIVGVRLEPLIGRGLFSMIFVASALAGEAGSLLGNDPGIPSVGASGAITGLIAALFVSSFDPEADADQTISRLRMSLFFGVPALLPLVFGSSGNVDYFAHGGGALAGGVLALMPWVAFRSYDSLPRSAGITFLAGFAVSLACAGFAAAHYSFYTADAAQYIRTSDLQATTHELTRCSLDLVTRYPKDPRAHLFRAYFFMDDRKLGSAETEARTAISLATSDAVGGPVRSMAQIVLAGVLFEQGRYDEELAVGAEFCRTASSQLRRKFMRKMCDGTS